MDHHRIAVFTAKFDPTFESAWLTDELCEALADQGNVVDVLFLDWHREFDEAPVVRRGNTRVHVVPPVGGKSNLISKMIHWGFSSINVLRYYKSRFGRDDHDLLIVFSPSILFGFALMALKGKFNRRVLIQWDFFPYHQEQIGLIPFRWITRIGAKLESRLLSTFSYIGCMSPRNVEFLNAKYQLGSEVRSGVVPLWTKLREKPNVDRQRVRSEFGLPAATPVAVFGGQLGPGRGIEDVVAAAKLAVSAGLSIHFLFVGGGPRLPWLKDLASSGDTGFSVIAQVPRQRYLELVASCDVGIVATVRDVDIPTFPSKTIDYCCVGLPIVASVERSTDFGTIVSDAGFGLACEAGDGTKLLELCLRVVEDKAAWHELSRSSRRYYEDTFDVRKVAAQVISV